MPATDYNKTVIYVIKCRDDNITEEYVGSTTNFRSRKCEHKRICYQEKNKGYNLKIYQFIRANGGWDNWIMIQLEEYPCKTKREAEKREEEVRVERKATLNSQRAFRTEENRKEDRKKTDEETKDKRKEYNKKWAQENREKRNEYQRQTLKKNKEKINERRRQRYAEKKDIMFGLKPLV